MTAQLLTTIAPGAAGPAALAVLCDGAIRRFPVGCCGVLGPDGVLRILDPDRRIVAEYPHWTIVVR